MKLHRGLTLALLLPVLAGCTPALEVNLAFVDGRPILTFSTKGLFPRRLDSICLWSAEIIDDVSGKVALKLLASDFERSCASVGQVSFNKPERGLMKVGQTGGIVRGRTYHAEVIADEGMGKSQSWLQQ